MRVPHTRLSMAEVVYVIEWLRRATISQWSAWESQDERDMNLAILGKFEDWFYGRSKAHKLSVAELQHILAYLDPNHSSHEKLARRLRNLQANYVKQRKKRNIRGAVADMKGRHDDAQ